MAFIVIVIGIVIASVMVAALVNGNEVLIVFAPVDAQRSLNFVSMAPMRSRLHRQAPPTPTVSFLFTSAATITASLTATIP